MEKSPEQIIYDSVFKISLGLGYDTFTYLPAERVVYPFVFVGETSVEDRHTKTGVFGDITQSVHIYHSYKKRRELTTMMNQIKYACYRLNKADNIFLRLNSGDLDVLVDDTTTETLLHGVLDLEFTFNY